MAVKKPDIKELRHSAAHLLAHAVVELFPDTILTIGPATEEGYFYDMLPTRNFKEEDLPHIQEKMNELAEQNLPLTHEQMPKDEARKLYKNNPYKLELINDIPGDTVGIARQGTFYDLCKGGHVPSTGYLKHTKLTTISGSYWRADRSKQVLQRISGVAFFDEKDAQAWEQQREEAMKYDHRRIGKQLDLFSFHDEGVGFPFFHPRGKLIFNLLVDRLRKQQAERGYQEIGTPILLSDELWKRSGHYAHYKNNMYFCLIDEQSYAIKPMNCPGAFLLYKERPHSYRELPLRLSEFGLVHRHELSGVLHGLMRVRSFTQDDAHIICTPDQLEAVIVETIELTALVLKQFNFTDLTVGLSTRPEKAMGSDQLWETATNALANALKKSGIKYTILPGEGAFYGPKIEFVIKDSMGREWTCSTIQVDFFQPENFDLTYVAPSGSKERPVAVHRAIYGSLERFIAILLEHYKGTLPFWLCPVQARVLTITDAQKPYGQEIATALKAAGIRAEMDESSDQISSKIKSAQLERIPWMLVVGAKEQDNTSITLRTLDGKQEFGLKLDQIIAKAEGLSR